MELKVVNIDRFHCVKFHFLFYVCLQSDSTENTVVLCPFNDYSCRGTLRESVFMSRPFND